MLNTSVAYSESQATSIPTLNALKKKILAIKSWKTSMEKSQQKVRIDYGDFHLLEQSKKQDKLLTRLKIFTIYINKW